MGEQQMTDWRTLETRPEGVFDVLARYYDPGLNRFLLQRFTNCIEQDFSIRWSTPFVNDLTSVDLASYGYRVVAWKPSPGPEDIPEWLEPIAAGPEDRR